MAHFALVRNGVVERVHVLVNEVILDDEGVEQESLGQQFLATLHGYDAAELVQCSYNGNMRVRFPAPGFSYDSERDAFIPAKPFPSWILDEESLEWRAPVPLPSDVGENKNYIWVEEVGNWVEVQ